MPEPMIRTLQVAFQWIPSINWEFTTVILILQLKLWLVQPHWAEKCTKQDSVHGHLTPGSMLSLPCCMLHSFSLASISKSHNHNSVSSDFCSTAKSWGGGILDLNFPWWPLLLWKNELIKARNWIIQLRNDKELMVDKVPCAKDFTFLL